MEVNCGGTHTQKYFKKGEVKQQRNSYLEKKNLKSGETHGKITCTLKISKWFWGIQGMKLVLRKCISDQGEPNRNELIIRKFLRS